MSIYFIEADGLIKIGFSDQVRKRTATIVGGQRYGGTFLGHMPGDRKVEKHLHDKFAEHRDYGEWFRPTEILRDLIAAIADPNYPEDAPTPNGEHARCQEDIFCEHAATSVKAYILASKLTRAEGLTKLSIWSGIGHDRLSDILEGNTATVTAGELAICTALGEASGHHSLEKLASAA
jgi:hypothetical protein